MQVSTFSCPRALQDPAEAVAVLIFPVTMLITKLNRKGGGGMGKRFWGILGFFNLVAVKLHFSSSR